jgi:16S rRNA (cytosine967-C5)-methyltransferase
MRSSIEAIAAEVIRNAGQNKPADAALREVLKSKRDLSPADAAEVSRLVFAHYRWHGWLRKERTLEAKFRLARKLQEQFRTNPSSLPFKELRDKAVPSWVEQEMEVSEDWLRALQNEPRLWLRTKAGQGSILAKKLNQTKPGRIPGALIYEGDRDLFKTTEFHAGEFEIQDVASQAVGLMCDPKPGETWWDACAGEGGKLLHLSDLMQNKGLIWASDRAGWRLQKLKHRAARAKVFNYRTALWNGGDKLPTKTKFDGVLIDAPCSGFGTWQRNPHARWTTTPRDVVELGEVQKRLLTHVAPSVKPGGKLIYAVCTLTQKETTGVAEAFGVSHPGFEPLSLPVQKIGLHRPVPSLTIWPQDLDGNGMFIAAWRRKN